MQYPSHAEQPASYVEGIMREWLIFGIGGAIGVAIGIMIGEAFNVSHLVGKILAIASATLGACIAMGVATMTGWIKREADTA